MKPERIKFLVHLLAEATGVELAEEQAPQQAMPLWHLQQNQALTAPLHQQIAQLKADRDHFEEKFTKASQEAAELRHKVDCWTRQDAFASKRLIAECDAAQASARTWQEKCLEFRHLLVKAVDQFSRTHPLHAEITAALEPEP